MSSVKHYTPTINRMASGDQVVYPYTLENERLLYIISGKADLTLQMHFKVNALGMLEAISSSLVLNEAGQLVSVLDEAPVKMTLEAPGYYALPQGSEVRLSAREVVDYSLLEAKACRLGDFLEAAISPQGDFLASATEAPLPDTPLSENISVDAPTEDLPVEKPPIPKALRFEPKQRFFYYTVQNRANFIMLMIGIFAFGGFMAAVLPSFIGFLGFWSALVFVGYASYFEYQDVSQQKPVIAIVEDGLVLHTRYYRDMPLLWSEIEAMNLVVRENIGGSDLMLDLILARPEVKINHLTPALKWGFSLLSQKGYAIQLPRIAFKNSDFDMAVEALKDSLTLVRSQA